MPIDIALASPLSLPSVSRVAVDRVFFLKQPCRRVRIEPSFADVRATVARMQQGQRIET